MKDNVARVIEQMVELASAIGELGPKYAKFADQIANMADKIEAVK